MENILLGFRLEERRQGMGLKGNIRDLCDDRTASVSCQVVVTRPINVVKLNRMKYTHIQMSTSKTGDIWMRWVSCINVSILAVICTRVLHGKLSKQHVGSLCIISFNFMWIFNYLEIKGFIKKYSLEKILTVCLLWNLQKHKTHVEVLPSFQRWTWEWV